jgi:flagellar biosynthesis/type III secretory pathway protein FliH
VEKIDKLNIQKDKNKNANEDPAQQQQDQKHNQLITELNAEKERVVQLSSAIEQTAENLQDFYENSISGNKEQIVNLAIKIAEKFISAKIEKGEYDITAIIQDTVSELNKGEISVIKLNPADMETLEKIQEEKGEIKEFKGLKFKQDPETGRGECKVQTTRGTIEKLIDTSLERIEQTLLKTV